MTVLLDALSGVRRLAVDTAPFIYLVAGQPQFGAAGPIRRRARGVDRQRSRQLGAHVTQVPTLPFDKGAIDLADAYKARSGRGVGS